MYEGWVSFSQQFFLIKLVSVNLFRFVEYDVSAGIGALHRPSGIYRIYIVTDNHLEPCFFQNSNLSLRTPQISLFNQKLIT